MNSLPPKVPRAVTGKAPRMLAVAGNQVLAAELAIAQAAYDPPGG